MNWAFLQDFGPVGVLLLGAVGCAVVDLRALGRGGPGPASRWVALAALFLAFATSIGFWHSSLGPTPPDIEHGSLVLDRFALFFYAATLGAAGAVVLCGADSESELDPHRGVYHLLLLMSTAGVLFTATSTDLVSMAAGLALALLPMGLAQGLRKTSPQSVRSAARALSVSGFSLATLVGGLALLAGISGTTSLRQIPVGLRQVDPLLVLAALMLVLGASLQLGVFPLLWWRSEEGPRLPRAPHLAATVLGSLAAAVALLRLLPGALASAPASWSMTVAVVAAATLVLAPVLAWRQRRLGRAVICLLGAQLALVLATLPEISQQGTAAVLYLLLCTVPLAAALLGLLGAISAQGEGDGVADLRGLWARSPVLAVALGLLLVGLAGLPPMSGFFVRLLTAAAALDSGLGWLTWFELLSAVLSALVVFRWLLTIVDAQVDGPELLLPGRSTLVGILLCTTAVTSFGILIWPLLAIASRAALAPLVGP